MGKAGSCVGLSFSIDVLWDDFASPMGAAAQGPQVPIRRQLVESHLDLLRCLEERKDGGSFL